MGLGLRHLGLLTLRRTECVPAIIGDYFRTYFESVTLILGWLPLSRSPIKSPISARGRLDSANTTDPVNIRETFSKQLTVT